MNNNNRSNNNLPVAPPEWDLLLSAAQKNNVDRIQAMISDGVDPSHANGVGQSAVHIAALWGHVEAVDALLQAGANCRAQNNLTGATPLHMVAQSNKGTPEKRIQVVDLLLAAGADPSQTDNYGSLPIDCLREELPQLADKLIPQAPRLVQAILDANLELVQESLRSDGEVTISFRDQTPLMHAVKALISAMEDNDDDDDDDDDLTRAETLVSIIQVLLHAGADPLAGLTADNEDGPLFQLLAQLQIEMRKETAAPSCLLLQRAIEAFPRGSCIPSDGWQLLQRAARRNELTFLQYLIDKLEMDPNTKGRQGMTALQFAARSGRMDVLNYLLSLPNIDVHIADDRGQTPLEAARINQKEEAVQIIEEKLRTISNSGDS